MEQDATKLNEMKARRDALRERLRAKCEKIVTAVEAMPEPKTFLEAERAARAVMVVDKMVERVFSEPMVAKEDVKSRSQKMPVEQGQMPPSSPLATLPPLIAGEDEIDETPLSKTCLKLEQLAAKITALDAEFNGQKSAKQGP